MTIKNKWAAYAALTLSASLFANFASADGGFFPYRYQDIYETGQIAFINYDSVTRTEHLHILPKFVGDARDFAWIVPVPSLPELSESSIDLFRNCSSLTAPVWKYREDGMSCNQKFATPTADGGNDADVDIHESQLVGDFQTMIISASDASALTDSLTSWGFLHEDNQEDVLPIFEDYVARAWYFVTMKIDSTAFPPEYGRSDPYYPGYYWGIDPIHLTFESDEIIYPMKISAVSSAEVTNVVIYVAADNRIDFTGATTTYANRISASELRAIRERYSHIGAQLADGDFLTRLERAFSPAEMDEDLTLTAAASNSEFHQITYSKLPLGLILLLLGTLTCRFWPALLERMRTISQRG